MVGLGLVPGLGLRGNFSAGREREILVLTCLRLAFGEAPGGDEQAGQAGDQSSFGPRTEGGTWL